MKSNPVKVETTKERQAWERQTIRQLIEIHPEFRSAREAPKFQDRKPTLLGTIIPFPTSRR